MSNPNTITLEAEVPDGISAGQKFSIEHENRIFEVIAPEGSKSGETIHIIVAKVKYDDLQSIIDTGVGAAQALNEKYSIVARATAFIDNTTKKATELDEKYKISDSSIAQTALSTAQGAFEKIKALNEKYEVVSKVKGAVDRLVVYAIEIDAKYAVSTTAARLVVNGVNAVVSSKYVTPMTLQAAVAPPTVAEPAAVGNN